jgi:Uma2 family endonuclease
MSTATPTLSPAAYLAEERAAESKHEYIDGELRPMAGASRLHNLIAGMIVTLLNNGVAGRKVEVYPSEMRVRIPDGQYYYPDAVVAPRPPELEDAHQDTLLNPLVVFEVLSPSTEAIDRGEKLDNYRRIPSLSDYLIVSQDRIRIDHYSRVSDDEWRLVSRDSSDDVVALASLGVELKLGDLYREWLQR